MSKLFAMRTIMVACALATAVACGDDDDDNPSAQGGRGGTGGRSATGGTGGTGADSGAPQGGDDNGSGGTRGGTGGTSGSSGNAGRGGASGGKVGATGGEAGGGAGGDTGGTGVTGGAGGSAGAGDAGAGAGGDGGAGGAFSAVEVQALTDAQMLLVLDTLNAGEVEEAYAALPRLTIASVETFAQKMITDHNKARMDTATLAQTLALKPTPSGIQKELERMAMTEREALLETGDAEIDRVYMDTQVAAHAEALALLQTLQPAADAAQLKTFITTLETAVEAHHTLAVSTRDALE